MKADLERLASILRTIPMLGLKTAPGASFERTMGEIEYVQQTHAEDQIRTILEAIRTPTDGMIIAAANVEITGSPQVQFWQAMIDNLLDESA